MHLNLIIPSLEAGGAERVMVTLANAWAEAGQSVTLTTLADDTSDFYTVDHRVERVALDVLERGPERRAPSVLQTLRALRGAIRRSHADVVLSFIMKMNVMTLLAARGLGIPVVVSERVSAEYPFPRHWRVARRWLYPGAAALAVQTLAAERGFRSHNARVRCIPNPVLTSPVGSERRESKGEARPRLLAVGRLHPQKGFDRLIRSFAEGGLAQRGWELRILGEGPERPALERLVAELGLVESIRLPGTRQDMASEYASADAFVLSSRYEGFPNVLAEALASGLPAVAFDCPDGPADLVEHDVNGLLIPNGDQAGFTSALVMVAIDEAVRARLAGNAAASVARYGLDSVRAQWDRLFHEVTGAP